MATPTNVNIKQLNQIEEIVNGNFLIVETDKGTNIIDFKNFVVGPDNVAFYSDFATLCSQVASLSSYISTTAANLSASVDATVATQIASLCATVDQTYDRTFYQSGQLTIDSGNLNSESVAIITPPGVSLQLSDINVNFLTTVVPTTTAGTVTVLSPQLYGNSPNYSLQAEITNPAINAVVIGYNIYKPY